MGKLFDRIRRNVADDNFIIGIHADERLRERRIPAWQVVGGLAQGKLLCERPKDRPNPAIEVEQTLADGTPFKAVWSWLAPERVAKLVTVHFYDR